MCSVAPVLVTGALLWAQGVPVSPTLLGLTLLAVAFLQAGAQVLDVYLEHIRDLSVTSVDSNSSVARLPIRSPSMLVREGIYPLDALRVAVALLVTGAGLGVLLALTGGMPVLLLGSAGLAVAFLYSATSFALKRLPLGEPVVFLALGPGIVALTTLAQRHPVTPLALALGAALGLFAMALVEAANLRALAPEVRSGRNTLVRLLGRDGGRRLFVVSLLGAYALALVAALPPQAPHGALAVLFSLPIAVLPLSGGLRSRSAPTLDLVVVGAVRAYGFFAFWLVVGLLLGGLFLRLTGLLGM
jgi:1,4-dihydroxy-2-naphthoate octaprenyltransferase